MPKFKAGDFLRRDGDTFTGIIKVAEYHYTDPEHEYICFGWPSVRTDEIYINEDETNTLQDRLLTLEDISKIPNKCDLNYFDKDAKALLKEAVKWCLIKY